MGVQGRARLEELLRFINGRNESGSAYKGINEADHGESAHGASISMTPDGEFLNGLFQDINLGIVLVREDRCVCYFNARAAKMLPDLSLGQDFLRLLGENLVSEVPQTLWLAKKSVEFRNEQLNLKIEMFRFDIPASDNAKTAYVFKSE